MQPVLTLFRWRSSTPFRAKANPNRLPHGTTSYLEEEIQPKQSTTGNDGKPCRISTGVIQDISNSFKNHRTKVSYQLARLASQRRPTTAGLRGNRYTEVLLLEVTLDLEHETDRRAPKKMGRSAMNTRLPYASAVPSGVATNLAVALSASVPLDSVAFRASRTAAASGAETETCSASDMVLQRRTSEVRGQRWVCGGT
ncbi:hypothetical protein INR49_004755 [Caranx melampygus]|nr:hypothetical protein INR49_004755 [Caranx melampygus]